MSLIPWRYLSPRRSYFRELKVAKACPEIKHLIDKAAFYKLCDRIFLIPLIAISMIVLPLLAAIELLKKMMQTIPSIFPDFRNKRRLVFDEIYAIIPLDEIRERAGLNPVILKKPNKRATSEEANEEE